MQAGSSLKPNTKARHVDHFLSHMLASTYTHKKNKHTQQPPYLQMRGPYILHLIKATQAFAVDAITDCASPSTITADWNFMQMSLGFLSRCDDVMGKRWEVFGSSSGVASFRGPGLKLCWLWVFLFGMAGRVTFVMYDPHLGVAY